MSESPTIDFTAIHFPTDRLTVADLRRVYPYSFDQPRPHESFGKDRSPPGRGSIEHTLGTLIDMEREIANVAFKKAAGQSLTEVEASQDRDSYLELAEEFVTLGLATGENAAMELLRDIRRQAEAQAAIHVPPRP
jgi:hypothetical protein